MRNHFLHCGACWVLACMLLAVTLLVQPAAAQEPADDSLVSLEIEAGYNGNYRVSNWFPVTVLASNDGPDIRGELEWSYAGRDNELVVRQVIDLPRGARKRVTLYAVSNNFARVGELRLLEGEQEIVEEDVRVEPIEAERFVAGVVSTDDTLLNSLSAMQFDTRSGSTVVRLEAERIPEQVMALSTFDAIFIHNIATADLSDQQHAALRLWVHLGGQLVVGGGIQAEDTVSGLTDLLPVEVGELQADVSLEPLSPIVTQSGNLPEPPEALRMPESTTATVNEVTLKAGSESLDDSGLLTAWEQGSGAVIFCAFDLEELRAWSAEPVLWSRALQADARFEPAAAARWRNNNLLSNVLQLPELQLPSFGILVLFIAGYILLIGPINFLLLRRFKRIDLAWLTIPAMVAVFVLATYGASFVIRGVTPQLLQVTVVQSFEGQEQGQATMFMGIFSPRRSTYTLEFPANTLVSSERFSSMQDRALLEWDDAATRLRDVLVDVSSLRTFIVEQTVSNEAVQVSSTLNVAQNQITGEVQNEGNLALTDAMLVYENEAYLLGTLGPGETIEVEWDEDGELFPNRLDLDTEGLFNRQTMLQTLFDPTMGGGMVMSPFNPNNPQDLTLNEESVYLLGWQEDNPVEIDLAGTISDQQGLTLYMVQLEQ